ncbi:MAG: UvrB/UvrC motif-containing protein [Chitinispirillales bacterium]|jgi:protein arginine kinase activator|nr:UvrB/UvrC motif-containing protein [Chitinispirillales bacterium]
MNAEDLFGEGFGEDMDDDADEGGACFCDDCKVREANVHLTHVGEEGAETFHLCEECARERGVPVPDSDIILKGLEALAGAVGGVASSGSGNVKVTVKPKGGGSVGQAAAEEEEDIVCRKCGMAFSEFRSGGRLGCAECYDSFEPRLDRILVQIHGTSGHKGKRYGKSAGRRGGRAGLERLRRELDAAVRAEEFEQAAVIRDEIRSLTPSVK